MSLTVLEPGPQSLIVDLGRLHHRALGVPLGGAADRAAFMQGNALLGNDNVAAAIEFALAGPKLLADVDVAAVMFGPPFDAWIDDRPIPAGTTFNLHAGESLRIGATSIGLRGYLCTAGGLQTEVILGSSSAFEPLKRGDVLPCNSGRTVARSLGDALTSFISSNGIVTLRCLPGLQADWFAGPTFFGESFTVTPVSDRMGLRLSGKPLQLPGRELVSEPVCPGSVQVTNDGQCVILGVDGQTIGGYPKVAQVISADLDRLGQLRPGQAIRFELVTMDVADSLRQERGQKLQHNLLRLRASSE